MLHYESKPVLAPEPTWRLVVSIVLGSVACAVGLTLWWLTVPGLWGLATLTPSGRVRPVGFVIALFAFMIGGAFSALLFAVPAASLSKRRAAQIVAGLGGAASMLPFLNLILFPIIVFVRGIELGD